MTTRLLQFCQRDLWEADLHAFNGVQRFCIAFLRLVLVAGWEFKENVLSIRATSLVYTTLLSLVPLLAVMFSVLKAFGVHHQIEPVLAQALEPLGDKGIEITSNVIGFVNNLKVGVLGAVGVAGLFYTTYSLIEKIEEALNAIWRVPHGRPVLRRFSDYLSVVLVGPVLVFTAFGMTASAQSHWLVQQVLEFQPLGYLAVLAGKLLPFFVICFVFTFIYKLVPYTQVNLGAALVGGVTAGVFWQIAGMAFAAFVAGSTRYSAVYSSFAVLILFLIWLYVGWLIVLVGGQVAYYYQHPTAYLMRLRWQQDTHAFRELLALRLLERITQRYLSELPPTTEEHLSQALNVPLAVVQSVVSELIEAHLVVRTSDPEGIVLGRPPEFVDVAEVLDIISRRHTLSRSIISEDRVGNLLRRRDRAVREALEGVTLRTLAEDRGPRLEEFVEQGSAALELSAPPMGPEQS